MMKKEDKSRDGFEIGRIKKSRVDDNDNLVVKKDYDDSRSLKDFHVTN